MSKNSEKLYGAISGIGDKYLADAENYKPQRKKNRKIVYSAVAAMLGVAAGILSRVPLYTLQCNISTDAARLSFETMRG